MRGNNGSNPFVGTNKYTMSKQLIQEQHNRIGHLENLTRDLIKRNSYLKMKADVCISVISILLIVIVYLTFY